MPAAGEFATTPLGKTGLRVPKIAFGTSGLGNMPDLANSDTNRSSSFGRTGNAYDVRFSPGGSSGGVVTAIAANFAVLGNGTDTGNSIRMPAATSALFGVFPTRGLDRKSTRLNSSHITRSRMPSSA